MILAGLVDDAVPYAGATGIVGVVAFALKLLVTFQRDFTDRYASRLREQDTELARMREAQRLVDESHRTELDAVRAAHSACERRLQSQGRLLESLQERLEQLDRRRYNRPPEPNEEMP